MPAGRGLPSRGQGGPAGRGQGMLLRNLPAGRGLPPRGQGVPGQGRLAGLPPRGQGGPGPTRVGPAGQGGPGQGRVGPARVGPPIGRSVSPQLLPRQRPGFISSGQPLVPGSRPESATSSRSSSPPWYNPSPGVGIPLLRGGPVPVGSQLTPKIVYKPIDTHQKTIVAILFMLQISGVTIPKQLKVDLDTYTSGINTTDSAIYIKFLNKHRSESSYVDNNKVKELYGLSPHNVDGYAIYKNPGGEAEFKNKFEELFDNIFDKMDIKFNITAPRIFLTFIYDLIVGYTLTYKVGGPNAGEPVAEDIRDYYNDYFTYYIGKTAKKLLKEKGIADDEAIIQSLIDYGNGVNIPFLEKSRGGGESNYSDDEKIIGQIDLDLIE